PPRLTTQFSLSLELKIEEARCRSHHHEARKKGHADRQRPSQCRLPSKKVQSTCAGHFAALLHTLPQNLLRVWQPPDSRKQQCQTCPWKQFGSGVWDDSAAIHTNSSAQNRECILHRIRAEENLCT